MKLKLILIFFVLSLVGCSSAPNPTAYPAKSKAIPINQPNQY
ncbi:hypothetical protein RHO12_07735 [Orbus sturtevantii]